MLQAKTQNRILTNHGGFTMIELIMVIIILGILAVVAVPKYANIKTAAVVSAADGVYGAAQGAAAINFAAGLSGTTQPAGAAITTGALLLSAIDDTPAGWSAVGTTIGTTVGSTTYTITISSAETTTSKATLSKNW